MFAIVFLPALAGRKHEPLSYVGHAARPVPVEFRAALPSLEALDDRLDLKELSLGVLLVRRTGQRTFGAGAQRLLKVGDVAIRRRLGEQRDVTTGVVIDRVQRVVDGVDAFADSLALAVQLGLEVRNFADGVLVE